jgi:cellulose synthase/poly-beta-1,6-N-acetylglucosamine synthase-like glycosyltransferase
VQFDLPVLQVLAPLIFVIGAIYVLGPTLPISQTWVRAAIFVTVWLIVGRYLHWRFFTTVLPASGPVYQTAWIWFLFAVEILAIGDSLILYMSFLRRSDRSGEADAHEMRLRAMPTHALPSVDVYIPTYNEPLDVLEKTITGALCLDYPNFKVWVLDDGRRSWLKDFCELKGAGYITRPDNAHAKAGNINHALKQTGAMFVAIFDADFVVQREYLMRVMGFFEDPEIGIMQVPHVFYNNDPLQANLALTKAVPDDQRFFFESIMPSRDAWDAAFCCGSNSVTRREALRAIGDALPTESLTEDMLLSLKLLRKGYVTRYLCESLAFGLAPEGLQAFFIQRKRWARGAMQILYLEDGPLGKGLTLMQRLLFLPTHWLTQSLTYFLAAIIPIVFMWTGVLPMANVTWEGVVYYILPMILAMVGGICLFAPKQYFPLMVQVLGTFQCFKVLPSVLMTLIRPFGHGFKVTPKGSAAKAAHYDREVFWTAAVLMAISAAGVVVNVIPEWRIIEMQALIPVVAIWAGYNVLVLFLVCMMSLQGNVRRGEERIACDENVIILGPGDARTLGKLKDISLSGAGVTLSDNSELFAGHVGQPIKVLISEVGFVPGRIARLNGTLLGAKFDLGPCLERDLLIRKLFTSGTAATAVHATAWSATAAMLESIIMAPSPTLAVESGDAPEGAPARAAQKLPAQTLVIPPKLELPHWEDAAGERRAVA